MGNHIEKLDAATIVGGSKPEEIADWSEENCRKYGMDCEKLKETITVSIKLRKRILKELSELHSIHTESIPEDCPDNYCTDISRLDVLDLTKKGLKLDGTMNLDFMLFTDIDKIKKIKEMLKMYTEIIDEDDGVVRFREVSGVRLKAMKKI
jgi:hypothetical protein